MNISNELAYRLYQHYYNDCVDYFRDKDGHRLWEEIKEQDPDFANYIERVAPKWSWEIKEENK